MPPRRLHREKQTCGGQDGKANGCDDEWNVDTYIGEFSCNHGYPLGQSLEEAMMGNYNRENSCQHAGNSNSCSSHICRKYFRTTGQFPMRGAITYKRKEQHRKYFGGMLVHNWLRADPLRSPTWQTGQGTPPIRLLRSP